MTVLVDEGFIEARKKTSKRAEERLKKHFRAAYGDEGEARLKIMLRRIEANLTDKEFVPENKEKKEKNHCVEPK